MSRAFPPYQQRLRREERQTATTVNKGHGRIERRTLVSTTALSGYLDWPGVRQVFRLERQRTVGATTTVEVVFGITSLSRAQADATQLLGLVRQHWEIENRLNYVRDVTLGEDACRVRCGAAPQVLAAMRNVAVHLLECVASTSKAAATRRLAAKPHEAIRLIVT